MARIKYTWSEVELYNKEGIKICIVRANEDNRVRFFKVYENNEVRRATREEVSPYIDPDFEKRKAAKEKRIASCKAKKALRANMADWNKELNFTWA